MKIPEKIKSWYETLASRPKEVMDISMRGSIDEIIKNANNEYIYWDKFKHKEFPNKINAEDAWACLKMTRTSSKKIYSNIYVESEKN